MPTLCRWEYKLPSLPISWSQSIWLFCVSREFHSFQKLWEHFEQTQGPPSIIKEAQWSCMTSSFILLKHHFVPAERDKSKKGSKLQNKSWKAAAAGTQSVRTVVYNVGNTVRHWILFFNFGETDCTAGIFLFSWHKFILPDVFSPPFLGWGGVAYNYVFLSMAH